MKIDILTIFPNMFAGPFEESILRRAQDKLLVEIKIHDLRQWASDERRTVDDKPYGGGPGMILRVDIVERAITNLKLKMPNEKTILLTPQGHKFNQQKARELAKAEHLILIAGHYEGFDERVRSLVDAEISIGDYVLTGGELPAMVIVDAVVRLIPGVLGKEESLNEESFNSSTGSGLEYPQYTRPEEFKGMKVPPVLLSGHHAAIAKWRQDQAERRTRSRRPDLIKEND
ncbi:MAG: tRNA (guanosine(37)-N1)-methyltransferase TrmD [Candidatus Chisholmbacteria bacterium RIFCSPHIGHO2_01_FULL_48_12]|uniref:tRNA (guanine-N(1)-)-methyltransferase n=1 Tax=Candidatus Chisholmbacteria bacterium RIFCSPHIGHO2_01_FULL_48_12 TaxID=1797589 RepID=A0A1G1VV58_9BACT|nr:MAG: tRNA (guanosine(37)-N1)-methyltransferase TrmD [Candidatus Chisholmbacteria bacterium RIFCSPHIGHO2_01_FULL_48_12]